MKEVFSNDSRSIHMLQGRVFFISIISLLIDCGMEKMLQNQMEEFGGKGIRNCYI